MRTIHRIALLLAVAAVAQQSPAVAQSRSTVSSAQLDAAVSTPAPGARALVKQTLTSPQADAAAAQLGLSPSDVATRVASLDQRAVDELAEQILAGGHSTLVISTTTIIIVLLLLILLTD